MSDPLDSARRSLDYARRNGDRVATVEVEALAGLIDQVAANSPARTEEDGQAARCPSRRKGRRCTDDAGHSGGWHGDYYVTWDNDGRTRAQIDAAHPPPRPPLRLHCPDAG